MAKNHSNSDDDDYDDEAESIHFFGLGDATSDMVMFVTFMLTMIEMEEHNKQCHDTPTPRKRRSFRSIRNEYGRQFKRAYRMSVPAFKKLLHTIGPGLERKRVARCREWICLTGPGLIRCDSILCWRASS